ncbi:isoprenoid synthase domain-containing protein [Stachybotrys elegans]|uniref:Isoprenoid synthase domain-containing protein n=1 Tax=Stachybotrys elegans TaxID=80388 RepID=A0A8K0SEN4_9HYPO|nr:isoprenoid synthase domain-containing protein [Stachybotrys elegans]
MESDSQPLTSKTCPESPKLASSLRPLYLQFFQDLDLDTPLEFESQKLMDAVLSFASSTNIPLQPNTPSYQALMVGYSFGNNCLPYHDLDVKVYVTIYTWLIVLCDDAEQTGIVPDLEKFQQRWIIGEQQPTVLLQALAKQLRLSYDFYHPIVANLIVCSSFNFITSTALAAREGIKQKMTSPSEGGDGFAWYLRDKDGVGEAYAWFTFPKIQFPNPDIPVEAIDDMSRFFAHANDVLSFYKEELSGEDTNYINRKAMYQKADTHSVLRATAQDAVDCSRRIRSVLRGKGEYETAWRLYAAGYIRMHVLRARYRLNEVGVGREPDVQEILQ